MKQKKIGEADRDITERKRTRGTGDRKNQEDKSEGGWSDNAMRSKINRKNKKRGWYGLKKEEGFRLREDQRGCPPLITAPQIMCGAISAQRRFPLGLIKYLYCLLSMSQCCPDLSYQCDKWLMKESVHRQWEGRERDRQKEKKGKNGRVGKSLLFPHLVCKWSASVINYRTTLVAKRGVRKCVCVLVHESVMNTRMWQGWCYLIDSLITLERKYQLSLGVTELAFHQGI